MRLKIERDKKAFFEKEIGLEIEKRFFNEKLQQHLELFKN